MYIFLQNNAVRRAMKFLWLALFVYAVIGTEHCWAQVEIPPVPSSSIYVQDYDNLLSAKTKLRINDIGSQLAAATKAQVVIVTVQSLERMPIEKYSLELFNKWGIGDSRQNNGVLLLLAVKEKKTRIEVGSGLAGVLNNTKRRWIQDEYIIPYFSKGDYEEGLLNGYLALTNTLAENYNVQLEANPAPGPKLNWFMALLWGVIVWLKEHILITLGVIIVIILKLAGLIGIRVSFRNYSFDDQDSGGSDNDTYGGGSGGGDGSSSDF